MKTYAEWCKHYDYDPATDTAKADYERYREQLALFQSMVKCTDSDLIPHALSDQVTTEPVTAASGHNQSFHITADIINRD